MSIWERSAAAGLFLCAADLIWFLELEFTYDYYSVFWLYSTQDIVQKEICNNKMLTIPRNRV